MSNARENLTLAKTLYQHFNDRKLDEAAKHMTGDATWTNTSTGETLRGPAGYKESAQRWITALSDARIDIKNQIANDDYVVTEFHGRGTHDGPMKTPQGVIPATRKKLELPFCEILHFKSGKVSEGRLYYDVASMMRQLGLSGEHVVNR